MMSPHPDKNPRWRHYSLKLLLFGVCGVLLGRLLYLQVWETEHLKTRGYSAHLKTLSQALPRGDILDRNGRILAISTPISSVWANPQKLLSENEDVEQLARLLRIPETQLRNKIQKHAARQFIYLKRHISPAMENAVQQLGLRNINFQQEYQRYYPDGDILGHVVGFTDIDENGLEGIERTFNDLLRAKQGYAYVTRDNAGKAVDTFKPGIDGVKGTAIHLTIDSRIQYLAQRELASTFEHHQADSAAMIIVEVDSGDILAIAVQPGFNPNNSQERKSELYRNRAISDVFEPGSVLKPFIVAMALEAGTILPDTTINTSPGYWQVNDRTIRDLHDYGELDISGILSRSSNVGISKIALELPGSLVWSKLDACGFGHFPGAGLSGERSGFLPHHSQWYPTTQTSLAFGYGLSSSLFQLTQAYMTIATDGISRPLRLIKDATPGKGEQVFQPKVIKTVRTMLADVVENGTAKRAIIPGYRIAGKTGTSTKIHQGGYRRGHYTALFAGMVPAENPELLAVVMVDEPRENGYYGGTVAAPVFARVMPEVLRWLHVAPQPAPDKIMAQTGNPE